MILTWECGLNQASVWVRFNRFAAGYSSRREKYRDRESGSLANIDV
jgi:hypothetical protein